MYVNCAKCLVTSISDRMREADTVNPMHPTNSVVSMLLGISC
jgi:hypothetical protein